MEDEEIRALVARLARPHPSGGDVVERAAILAEGADAATVVGWITDHGGRPEATEGRPAAAGLHSSRLTPSATAPVRRYVLPAGRLTGAGVTPPL
jgi:hypothetical protein